MDNEQEKKDDNLKGYLWHENDCIIHRKGSVTINGEKKYIAIVESKNNTGKPKYELMMSLGLLYTNTPEEKMSERSPDVGGKITIDGQVYKFGGWKTESKEGTPYTDVSLKPVQESDAPF